MKKLKNRIGEEFGIAVTGLRELDATRPTTTFNQDMFIIAYTAPRTEFWSNGVKSYAEAYGYELPLREDGNIDTKSPDYLACKANASRMLAHPEIRLKIQTELLKYFNDKVADAKVTEIMINGKDSDALNAVKMYNELKQRIIKKVDVTVAARPFAALSDEELEVLANE